MREIGITKIQSAWITSIVALISMIGPLCLGPIAYKCNKYKVILVFCLLLSFIAYTALLFVPKVILTERQPKIFFDCTQSILHIERCPNWEGQCHIYPKRPATNFSNFLFTGCTYECPFSMNRNSSWYPIHVCFRSIGAESDNCKGLSHSFKINYYLIYYLNTIWIAVYETPFESGDVLKRTDKEIDKEMDGDIIQFDTRFDRWPVFETTKDDIIDRVFNGLPTCTYRPAPPILVNQILYSNVQCKPFVQNCNAFCNINLRHRRKSSGEKDLPPRLPTPCIIETGDPKQTFYLYLLIRSVADFALFTAYTLLDALSIAMTNDFDSIYGGFSKLWAIMIPMIAWPPIVGQLIDYFSTIDGPNYAPLS